MSPDWSAEPAAIPYAELKNPATLNLYGYVQNNPMRYTDADGHRHTECDPPHAVFTPTGVTVTAGPCREVSDWWDFLLGKPSPSPKTSPPKPPKSSYAGMAVGGTIACQILEPCGVSEDLLLAGGALLGGALLIQGALQSQSKADDVDKAGCAPGAAKDRSTVQGRLDQLEGVEQTQKDTTKKQGYRISKEKSQQEVKHGLKQIVEGARNPEDE